MKKVTQKEEVDFVFTEVNEGTPMKFSEMETKSRKVLAVLLTAITFSVQSSPVFAGEDNTYPSPTILVASLETINLNELDLSLPHVFEEIFFDGERSVEITMEFTPDLSRNTATVGTWTTTSRNLVAGVEVMRQSFDYDLSRPTVSGVQQWRISNARNHATSGAGTHTSRSLTVHRGTSTNTLSAEISGSFHTAIGQNQWFDAPINATPIATTRITRGGSITSTTTGW